MNLTVTLQH